MARDDPEKRIADLEHQLAEQNRGAELRKDRYRAMARTLGFEGHIAWAEATP
jgi:uncharacterized coiled-coil protein SlyX